MFSSNEKLPTFIEVLNNLHLEDNYREMARCANLEANKFPSPTGKMFWYTLALTDLNLIPEQNRNDQDWLNSSINQQAISILCEDNVEKLAWLNQAIINLERISPNNLTDLILQHKAICLNKLSVLITNCRSEATSHYEAACSDVDINEKLTHHQAVIRSYLHISEKDLSSQDKKNLALSQMFVGEHTDQKLQSFFDAIMNFMSIPSQDMIGNDWRSLASSQRSLSRLCAGLHYQIFWQIKAVESLKKIPLDNFTNRDQLDTLLCHEDILTIYKNTMEYQQAKDSLRSDLYTQCLTNQKAAAYQAMLEMKYNNVATFSEDKKCKSPSLLNHSTLFQPCSPADLNWNINHWFDETKTTINRERVDRN